MKAKTVEEKSAADWADDIVDALDSVESGSPLEAYAVAEALLPLVEALMAQGSALKVAREALETIKINGLRDFGHVEVVSASALAEIDRLMGEGKE